MLFALLANAQDYEAFGLKGRVKKVVMTDDNHTDDYDNPEIIEQLDFDKGMLVACKLNLPTSAWTVEDFHRTGFGFGGDLDITLTNGRITQAKHTEDDEPSTTTFTYNSDGTMASCTEKGKKEETVTCSRCKGSGYITCRTCHGEGMIAYRRWDGEIDAKRCECTYDADEAEDESLYGRESCPKCDGEGELTVTKNFTCTCTYSNYDFDEYGNWISRTCKYTGYKQKTVTETREIEYEPDFISEVKWNELEKGGDIYKIEQFGLDNATTDTYKRKASDYWSKYKLERLSSSSLSATELEKLATHRLCNDLLKEQALRKLGTILYNESSNITDYKTLEEMANKRVGYSDVFDYAQKEGLKAHAKQIRVERVANLCASARRALDSKEYYLCDREAVEGLEIDPKNRELRELRAEAEYHMLINTTTSCEAYLRNNPYSKYREKVEKKLNRLNRKEARQGEKSLDEAILLTEGLDTKPCYFGFGLGFFGGHKLFGMDFFLSATFGPYSSYVSGHIDAGYEVGFHSTENYDIDAGAFKIPVSIRCKFKRTNKFFVSAGVESIIPVSASYKLKSEDANNSKAHGTKDKNLLNGVNFAPRIGFGWTLRKIEIEAFVNYTVKPRLKMDYANSVLGEWNDVANYNSKSHFGGGAVLRIMF